MSMNPAATATPVGALPIRPDQHDRALATLVLAFAADPVERWLWPRATDYLTHFPPFLDAFGGGAFRNATAWHADDLRAVALWLPPDAAPDDDAIVASLLGTTDAQLHADILAVLEQLDAAHPHEPHWYLPWFGVDPSVQSQGLGSTLLRACLARVDADHVPAYLETPNPRNIPFYERHGFRAVAVTESTSCPPVTTMLRAAR